MKAMKQPKRAQSLHNSYPVAGKLPVAGKSSKRKENLFNKENKNE